MISSIIWTIIVGLVIGLLGRLILPGRQNISLLMTCSSASWPPSSAASSSAPSAYNNNNGGIPWLSIIVGAILAAVGILIYGRVTHKAV